MFMLRLFGESITIKSTLHINIKQQYMSQLKITIRYN